MTWWLRVRTRVNVGDTVYIEVDDVLRKGPCVISDIYTRTYIDSPTSCATKTDIRYAVFGSDESYAIENIFLAETVKREEW
jgi:hypothetical protein